jgi:putative acetyltransferase
MNAATRPATEADSSAVIAVVRACWAGYPGVVFDLESELAKLKNFATHYEKLGGRAWVAELDYRIVGCVAATPDEEAGVWGLHMLNVMPTARRQGVASALVRGAELAARTADAVRMVLWSDTRFIESHALYEALGYQRLPTTRELHDLSNTVEYRFRKSL